MAVKGPWRRESEKAQGQIDGVEGEMHGHGREEGARTGVEPGEGGADEPERDERGGVDVDKREEEAGKEHGQPDGHDFCASPENDATEEQFLYDGGFEKKE